MERGTTTVVGEFQAYSDDEVKELNLYGYIRPEERKLKHLSLKNIVVILKSF